MERRLAEDAEVDAADPDPYAVAFIVSGVGPRILRLRFRLRFRLGFGFGFRLRFALRLGLGAGFVRSRVGFLLRRRLRSRLRLSLWERGGVRGPRAATRRVGTLRPLRCGGILLGLPGLARGRRVAGR
ncbi:hypothetical protein [Nonomuraea terrae]|uniref:hypothetical protein n=1 Tax=Nonomuraea terrae TaxID=2530383 RepID=UPI001652860B|nr:hypothetical protein [Nonomuraea terrae]